MKTLVQIPDEAQAIRDAAEWILSGWSLNRVANALVERGMIGAHRRAVVDPTADPALSRKERLQRDAAGNVVMETALTYNSVKSWFKSPTIAGMRVHRGEVVGRGIELISQATWNAVRDTLATPRVLRLTDGLAYPLRAENIARNAPARRYLLTTQREINR